MTYLALLIGGMVGGVLRYTLDTTIPSIYAFPFNTLVINLIGSFILGLFYGIADVRDVKPWLRVGFGTGIIGTFTTFSAFCFDLSTLSSFSLAFASVYAFSSILGGPLLAFLGDQVIVATSRRSLKGAEELSV